MPENLSESQLIKIWQHQLLDRDGLATEDGEPVEIIYPGRLNDEQGADFRDAVIATNEGLKRGDIEVHVRSSDWWSHQHHQDAIYNPVILHVVMWHNAKTATKLQNGREVPVLALHKYIKTPVNRWLNLASSRPALSVPCLEVGRRRNTSAIVEFLDRAGEERFLAKVARFQRDLTQMEASESLYQGIMGALGYTKNKLPMLKLARSLPLATLQSMTQGKISEPECLARLQALLLGTAGLLSSQRQNRHQEDEGWIDKLEGLWTASGHTKAISEDEWHLFKVRPNNFPPRRIAAMSYLILRYRERGMVEEVVNMINETPVSQGYLRLEKGFMVTANGYWANHFDFGLNSHNSTLLGRWRAADIIVNVLLPFTFAWSKLNSQPEVGRRAFDLYCSYPKLGVNTVERHMIKQLELNSRLVNSAQRQQGLIHIYTTLCRQGRCQCCRLSQLEARHHIQV